MEAVLEEAIEVLRSLPEDLQESVARAILRFTLEVDGRRD
jgi:hypothetical protein